MKARYFIYFYGVSIADLNISLLEPGSEVDAAADDIWRLLSVFDREFFPNLSARSDTTEHNLTKETLWGGPISFFDTVMKERILVASIEERVVGLLTFIPHYREEMLAPWSPSTYASTIGVLPQLRRRGIGSALNDALDHLPEELASPWITRRTWSTNLANLTMLHGRGFRDVVRMVDHRGKGVDTIYLARPSNPATPFEDPDTIVIENSAAFTAHKTKSSPGTHPS